MATDIGPFSTAIEMLDALEARHVSAVELVEDHLAWIDKHDGVLNAIPVRTPERAIEAAKHADEARAAGERRALLGLPDDVEGVDSGRRPAAVRRDRTSQ